MDEIKKFSQNIWSDLINFQATWWNISLKKDWILYIKSSWYKIIDIYKNNSLSKIDINGFFFHIKYEKKILEENLVEIIKKNNKSKLKSSIETWFHLLLNSKYVIHTHNIYINVLLCMEWVEVILKNLFWEEITIIDYVSPWVWLFKAIKNKKNIQKIIFLKNHWIILHWNNSFIDLYNKLNKVELKIRKYLKLNNFQLSREISNITKHIFPDSVVINDIEIYSSYCFIINEILRLWWNVKYLSEKDVNYIKNMTMEKYRKNLFNKKSAW